MSRNYLVYTMGGSSVMLLFLLASCAPKVETKALVDRSALTTLQRLGVRVTQEEDFSVWVARDQPPPLGWSIDAAGALAELIRLGVTAAARSMKDMHYLEQLTQVLGVYDPTMQLTDGLLQHLQRAQLFAMAVKGPAEAPVFEPDQRLDGVLSLTLKQWGLRRCDQEPDARGVWMQVGLHVKGHLIAVANNTTVWEREYLYLDGECHTLEALHSQEGLLVNVLSRAIGHLAGKTGYEIRFP